MQASRRAVSFPHVLFVAAHRHVEVDLVGTTVDARELRLAPDIDAAPAAHAGAVDHQRVHRDQRLYLGAARRLRDSAHHRHRADGDHVIGPSRPVAVDQLREALRDEALEAGRAVVGANFDVGAQRPQLVGQDQQVLAARAEDRSGLVAARGELAHQAEQRGRAEAAAHAADVAAGRNIDVPAQRARHVEDLVAGLERAHPLGSGPDFLHHDGDRARLTVVVGDGDRNSLAAIAHAEHHELAGPRRCRDQRRVDAEKLGDRGELARFEYSGHVC